VLRYPEDPRDDPTVVVSIMSRESPNPLARKFPERPFFFETVRVVKPLADAQGYKAEALLEVRPLATRVLEQEIFWAEKNVSALENIGKYVRGLTKQQVEDRITESLPVAVAVKDSQDKPRAVVFGDAEFASDAPMAGRFRGLPVANTYFNLMVSTIDYLTDRPGVGARPKETKIYIWDTKVQTAPLAYLPAWLMSLGIFGLGMGVWVVRRR